MFLHHYCSGYSLRLTHDTHSLHVPSPGSTGRLIFEPSQKTLCILNVSSWAGLLHLRFLVDKRKIAVDPSTQLLRPCSILHFYTSLTVAATVDYGTNSRLVAVRVAKPVVAGWKRPPVYTFWLARFSLRGLLAALSKAEERRGTVPTFK